MRNLRVPDERWLPALSKAEAEGRSLTDVIAEALDAYNAEPLAKPRRFTFGNWPDARAWEESRRPSFLGLWTELNETIDQVNPEYLAVAAWLAVTHHPADMVQQKRVITGHLLRYYQDEDRGTWRERYRDTRHLSKTVQAILDRHLPLSVAS